MQNSSSAENSPRLFLLLAAGSTFLAMYQLALLRSMTALFNPYASTFAMAAALLGLGIGGGLSSLPRKTKDGNPATTVSLLLCAMSIAAALSMTLPCTIPLGSKLSLFIILTLNAIPFAGWGYGMGLCFRTMPSQAAPLYAVNLLGAAFGTSICFLVMKYLGGPVMAGWLSAIALALTGFAAGRSRWGLVFALSTFLLLAVAGNFTGWETAPIPRWNRAGSRWGTQLSRMVYNVGRVHRLGTVWNQENRTDLVGLRKGKDAIRWIFEDGSLHSIMVGRPEVKNPEWFETPFALITLPLKSVQPEKLLAVDTGGGVEVRMAADLGVPHIRVIKPGRPMKAIFEKTGAFHGNLTERKGVNITYGGIRRILRNERDHYDLLFLPLREPGRIHWVGEAGREDRGTTRNAFKTYRNRLSPGGMLAVLAPNEPLFVRALLTLNEICDADPESTSPWIGDHAFGFKLSDKLMKQGQGNGYNYLLLVAKGNPGNDVMDRISSIAGTLPVEPLFGPRMDTAKGYEILKRRPTPAALRRKLTRMLRNKYRAPFDLAAATEDSPFFYQLTGRLDPYTSWGVGIGVFLILAYMVFPLAPIRPLDTPGAADRPPIPLYLLYFAILGTVLPMLEAAFGEIAKRILADPNHAMLLMRWTFPPGLAAGAMIRQKNRGERQTGFILAALVLLGSAYGGSRFVKMEQVLLYIFPITVLITGLLLGGVFPSAIRSLQKRLPELIPWAWGVFAAGASLGFASIQWLPRLNGWYRVWECTVGGLLVILITGILAWRPSPSPQSSPPGERKYKVPSPARGEG